MGRRVRAARHLGGFDSVPALAEKINAAGFSTSVLRRLEDGRNPLDRAQALVIAEACGIDPSFFGEDLGFPTGKAYDDTELMRRLDQLEARLVLIDGKLDGNHDGIGAALKLLGEAADPGGHDASTERVPRPASHDRVQANRPPARRSQ